MIRKLIKNQRNNIPSQDCPSENSSSQDTPIKYYPSLNNPQWIKLIKYGWKRTLSKIYNQTQQI